MRDFPFKWANISTNENTIIQNLYLNICSSITKPLYSKGTHLSKLAGKACQPYSCSPPASRHVTINNLILGIENAICN